MIPPTTYLYAKILPDNAPTADLLHDFEERVQGVFDDVGIKAYVYSEQIIKQS